MIEGKYITLASRPFTMLAIAIEDRYTMLVACIQRIVAGAMDAHSAESAQAPAGTPVLSPSHYLCLSPYLLPFLFDLSRPYLS